MTETSTRPAPRRGDQGPVLTILVPTFNERDNVAPLLARLAPVVAGLPVEVLFVDDSTDDTPRAIQAAAPVCPVPVRLVHRGPHARVGGLGGAVLAGFHATTAEWVLVMDGDLQHPPELVAPMLRRAGGQRRRTS